MSEQNQAALRARVPSAYKRSCRWLNFDSEALLSQYRRERLWLVIELDNFVLSPVFEFALLPVRAQRMGAPCVDWIGLAAVNPQ